MLRKSDCSEKDHLKKAAALKKGFLRLGFLENTSGQLLPNNVVSTKNQKNESKNKKVNINSGPVTDRKVWVIKGFIKTILAKVIRK